MNGVTMKIGYIGSAITIFELLNIKIGVSLCVPVTSRVKKGLNTFQRHKSNFPFWGIFWNVWKKPLVF